MFPLSCSLIVSDTSTITSNFLFYCPLSPPSAMAPLDASFFHPFNRWPFTSCSTTNVTASSPSPPLCSCKNFLGASLGDSHSAIGHQCLAGFSPPSPQLSQENSVSSNTELEVNKGPFEGQMTTENHRLTPAPEAQGQRQSNGAGRSGAKNSDFIGSGFFKKDSDTGTRASTTGHMETRKPGKEAGRNILKVDDTVSRSLAALDTVGPRTPPKNIWKRTSSVAPTGGPSANPTWGNKSTRPIDKPWRRSSDPVQCASLKFKPTSDRAGCTPPVEENRPSSVPSVNLSNDFKENVSNRKTILGCSQCVFEPRLKVVPCGCLICLGCGGRFWGAGNCGEDVYCGCGEVRVPRFRPIGMGGFSQSPACLVHDQFRLDRSPASTDLSKFSPTCFQSTSKVPRGAYWYCRSCANFTSQLCVSPSVAA